MELLLLLFNYLLETSGVKMKKKSHENVQITVNGVLSNFDFSFEYREVRSRSWPTTAFTIFATKSKLG